MRQRNGVVLASSIVVLLVTAIACSGDDPPADQSAVTSSEPVDATTTTASAPDPTVPYVAPTAIRELIVDWATLGMLYPLNETELLSIVRYGPNPDGTRNPRFWINDVVTGTSTQINGPPFFAQAGGGSTIAATSRGVYLASATCEDRAGECIAPRVEVWWWDATTYEWSVIGSYDPSELVGEHWPGSIMGLNFAPFEEDDDLPLAVSDDSDNEEENLGTHVIVIDPDTGEFEREPPEAYRDQPSPGCETPSGLSARLASAQTLEPGRSSGAVTGTLEIRPPDEEWTDVAGVGPASHLACALDSIWVLADERWLNIDEQGATRSAQIIESPEDVDVALDVFTVVGEGTDHVSLVRQLGTDQRADLELRADRLDIIVYTDPDRPPVAHKVPRGVGTGPEREASVGTYADALPVVGLQPYPPFAISLPGGRVVILAANGNRLQTLLVAE